MADTQTVAPTRSKTDELARKNAEALLGGGEARIEAQHKKGDKQPAETPDADLADAK